MNEFANFMDNASAVVDGFVVAAFTDRYKVGKWEEEKVYIEANQKKLLEIRVFNMDREVKAIRSDIGRAFIVRDTKSFNLDGQGVVDMDAVFDYFDESQYLDIDLKKSKSSKEVYATGGGKYSLPILKLDNAIIVVRHYLSQYANSGQARVCDWRLVDIKEGL